LKKRDMLRPKLVKPRGILHQSVEPAVSGYGRYWPAEDLAPFVEHFWTVAWDVAEPEVREVLPHPSVHLVLERGQSRLAGVPTRKFTRVLEGKGRVLGTKLRPGGFRPFLGRPVSGLTGRTLPLAEVFGPAGDELEARALACADPREGFEVVQGFLRGLGARPDPAVELVGRIAERAMTDREITRVEHLVEIFGIGARRLQRLFGEYVGVSPKWIIQRYRLHEAVERIAAGTAADGATLAGELGYADQAHFIRDFKKLVGSSPAEYARGFRERAGAR
jgi:AraC-like DNA-binding protein